MPATKTRIESYAKTESPAKAGAARETRVCVDVISPAGLRQALEARSLMRFSAKPAARRNGGAGNGNGPFRAIAPIRTIWPNGSKLRVKFLGGTSDQRLKVRDVANQWMDHANLTFEFVADSARSEIRVAFVQDGRSWSYVGLDNLNIPAHAATMNFGWALEDGTILHEFGHAIGLSHEHQNPDGGIEWIEENVIRDLSGPPNEWDPDTIRHNVLDKYRADQIRGTKFDGKSIMLYGFPGTWTRSGQGTSSNRALSATDKSFVGSEQMYPKPGGNGGNGAAVTELKVAQDVGVDAAIGAPGEEDLYKFRASTAGNYTIETEGPTDVVMRLFGPNSRTALIAEDDDSGDASNARISRTLAAGEYFVQVRHFNPQANAGSYRIKVSR